MRTLSHVLIVLFASVGFASGISTTAFSGFTEVAGTTDSYKIKDKDGFVDFSLVMPAMTMEELMNFDLARIFSPEVDELNILSKTLQVPSNLSLPKQVESYFLSFTLDKPEYRAYVRDVGQYNLYALHGSFPIKKVVDGFQGGQSLFEMVNLFAFKGGGAQVVDVKGPTKDVKIGINTWALDTTNTVSVPTIPKNTEVLSFSLFKVNDELYPADIKRVLSGKSEKLTNRNGLESYVLSVLLNSTQTILVDQLRASKGNIVEAIFGSNRARAAFDMTQISYSIQKVNGANPVMASFLPQVPTPQFNAMTSTLSFTAPQTIAGVSPYSMLVVLSEVTAAGSESLPIDVKNTVWVGQSASWQSGMAIPSSATAMMVPGKKYAFEVLFLGTATAASDTTIDWAKVTHVTRSTLNL
ncbi:MAG: hypothetical protein IT287_05290 [Bdellovibrionaceae bacterium]|nr:hypothetical protein [Pseudobdellovibrionaceae bacterium]